MILIRIQFQKIFGLEYFISTMGASSIEIAQFVYGLLIFERLMRSTYIFFMESMANMNNEEKKHVS